MKKTMMFLLAFILLSSISLAQEIPCTNDDDCIDDPFGECCDVPSGICYPCGGEPVEVPEFSTVGLIIAVAVIGIAAVFIIKKRK